MEMDRQLQGLERRGNLSRICSFKLQMGSLSPPWPCGHILPSQQMGMIWTCPVRGLRDALCWRLRACTAWSSAALSIELAPRKLIRGRKRLWRM